MRHSVLSLLNNLLLSLHYQILELLSGVLSRVLLVFHHDFLLHLYILLSILVNMLQDCLLWRLWGWLPLLMTRWLPLLMTHSVLLLLFPLRCWSFLAFFCPGVPVILLKVGFMLRLLDGSKSHFTVYVVEYLLLSLWSSLWWGDVCLLDIDLFACYWPCQLLLRLLIRLTSIHRTMVLPYIYILSIIKPLLNHLLTLP